MLCSCNQPLLAASIWSHRVVTLHCAEGWREEGGKGAGMTARIDRNPTWHTGLSGPANGKQVSCHHAAWLGMCIKQGWIHLVEAIMWHNLIRQWTCSKQQPNSCFLIAAGWKQSRGKWKASLPRSLTSCSSCKSVCFSPSFSFYGDRRCLLCSLAVITRSKTQRTHWLGEAQIKKDGW